MNILYDYQAFNQHHGGVSRYHVELIKNLRLMGHECKVPFLLSNNVYLDEIDVSHIYPLGKYKNCLMEKAYKWIDQRLCLHAIEKGSYDVFHPTFLNPYFIGHTKGKPVVVTMHDLNHEKLPLYKSEIVIEKRKKVLADAQAVIAISSQTKDDLVNLCNVPKEKITVVYHGSDQSLIKPTGNRILEAPYLLYIGGRNLYKNFTTFIQAFARIDKDIHLVCTGSPFNASEEELLHKQGVRERVHQMFVTDEELNNLLCHAMTFVYPSLMEGFGLPILEAFRCGCPCVISDIPCFHEVAGRAALYFNPQDVESMAETVSNVIAYSDTIRCEVIRNGYEQLKLFTWEKTAKETEKVYQSVL